MVRTYGLTHIVLAVRDIERSLAFYQQVLGVVPDGYEVELWHELPTPVDPIDSNPTARP